MTHLKNRLTASAVMLAGALGLSATALPLTAAVAAAAPTDKTVIEKKDDLPRHSYILDIPVSALFDPDNRDELRKLARQVRRDLEADLATYDIRDDNTVQGFYGVLGTIAILDEDWQGYLDMLDKRRVLESKEASRMTLGLTGEAIVRARMAGNDSTEAVAEQLQQLLEPLPYATIEANLKSLKGSTEILTRAYVLGAMESNYQPVVDRNNGEISYDIASSLLGASYTLDYFIPAASAINGVLSYTIDANQVEKADIWAARQVVLDADTQATPVTLAVWDSGVDTAIFAANGQLWRNDAEVPDNGLDDDDNGFVDDVHGIAYDVKARNVRETLYPIGDVADDELALQRMVKGLGDIQFNVDTDEAAAVRKQMATLPQDGVKEFLESLSVYANYSHGTHVAGIATEGNPFARVLVTRMTYGHELIPPAPKLADAHREAAMFLEVGEYLRENGVRVVNMSWGGSLRGIEDALEANAVGANAEERKALAREIFAVGDKALRSAIADSPDILFVVAAGNSDNDIRFDEFYPSSYEYPNLITVGAVDSAGDETSFTSLGKVDVYGNGYEVESYVPGGNRIAFNGTSMASPQVMNLAGKLLALNPDLSVAELKSLIIDSAEEKALETRTIRLIDPQASLQALADHAGTRTGT
jgi:subtilisin family serine protease